MPWRCLTSSEKGQTQSAKQQWSALQDGYRCSRSHRLLRQGLPHLFLGIYVLQAWRACSMMEPWQHLLPGSLFAAETGTSCSKIHALALLDIFPERTKAISQTAVVNTALQAGYRCSRRHRLLRQGLPHLFLGIYVLQAWRACSMMEPWQHLLPGSLFAAETGTSCSKIHALAPKLAHPAARYMPWRCLTSSQKGQKPSAKQQWSTLRFKPATGAQGVIGYFGRASRTCS